MNGKKSLIHFKIFYGLLLLALASLPFTIFLMLPIAILLLINWISEWNWKEKICCLKQIPGKYFFAVYISLYILYLTGILYSDNVQLAFSNLEGKSWLFLAPVLFFTSHPENLTKSRIDILLRTFLFSSALLVITNLVLSTFEYAADGRIENFFYMEISRFMHPSYSSMFMSLSVVFSLYFLFLNPVKPNKLLKILYLIAICLMVLYIFLLQSKAGLLVFFLVFFIMGLYLLNHKKRRWAATFTFILCWITIPVVFIFFVTTPLNRMGLAVQTLENITTVNNPHESTQQRIAVWKVSWNLAIENLPFGVGPGDVKDVLIQAYKDQELTYILNKQLNAHNQYLQTFLATGIPGLFSLITVLLFTFIFSIKKKDILIFTFIIIIGTNMLVESMLERHAGVDFLAIFASLLVCRVLHKKMDSLEERFEADNK